MLKTCSEDQNQGSALVNSLLLLFHQKVRNDGLDFARRDLAVPILIALLDHWGEGALSALSWKAFLLESSAVVFTGAGAVATEEAAELNCDVVDWRWIG